MAKKQKWTGAHHSSPLVIRRSGSPEYPLVSDEAAYLDRSVFVGQALNDHYWASNAGTYGDLVFYIDKTRLAVATDTGCSRNRADIREGEHGQELWISEAFPLEYHQATLHCNPLPWEYSRHLCGPAHRSCFKEPDSST